MNMVEYRYIFLKDQKNIFIYLQIFETYGLASLIVDSYKYNWYF